MTEGQGTSFGSRSKQKVVRGMQKCSSILEKNAFCLEWVASTYGSEFPLSKGQGHGDLCVMLPLPLPIVVPNLCLWVVLSARSKRGSTSWLKGPDMPYGHEILLEKLPAQSLSDPLVTDWFDLHLSHPLCPGVWGLICVAWYVWYGKQRRWVLSEWYLPLPISPGQSLESSSISSVLLKSRQLHLLSSVAFPSGCCWTWLCKVVDWVCLSSFSLWPVCSLLA